MGKSTAHQRYRNSDNKIVPGVTTIIGQLNKPQLVVWANRLGLQGIDSAKYRDDKADIGSLAHTMILNSFKQIELDTSDYTQAQIDSAETCFIHYLEWAKDKEIEPTLIETQLVANTYGGTLDFYGKIDGELVIVDYKTGGIYREALIQVTAYRQLLITNGHEAPVKAIILGIPRDDQETFKEVTFNNWTPAIRTFHALTDVYYNLKEIKLER